MQLQTAFDEKLQKNVYLKVCIFRQTLNNFLEYFNSLRLNRFLNSITIGIDTIKNVDLSTKQYLLLCHGQSYNLLMIIRQFYMEETRTRRFYQICQIAHYDILSSTICIFVYVKPDTDH